VNIYQFRKLIGDAIGYGLYFCVLAFSVVIRHPFLDKNLPKSLLIMKHLNDNFNRIGFKFFI
jgi:hypothetical protein